MNLELRKYLYKNLYFNPVVHGPNTRAMRMLDALFQYYLKHIEEIGEQARKRARRIGRHRAICDYLAGMTDQLHPARAPRIFGPADLAARFSAGKPI